MALAIEAARTGVSSGQSPFGCCIVREGRVLACSHNTVWQHTDPTRHAEVNAISEACRTLGTVHLAGCTLYATCEPCPMCFSAAHWARVSRIVFGASIEDARLAGFNEIELPAARLRELAGKQVELVPGFMQEECRALFRLWQEQAHARPY